MIPISASLAARRRHGLLVWVQEIIQDLEKVTQRRIGYRSEGHAKTSSQIVGKVNSPSTRRSLSIP
jgi:hypothetical protein